MRSVILVIYNDVTIKIIGTLKLNFCRVLWFDWSRTCNRGTSSIDASNFFSVPGGKKKVSRTLFFRHRLIVTTYYRGVGTNLTTVDRVSKYCVKTRGTILLIVTIKENYPNRIWWYLWHACALILQSSLSSLSSLNFYFDVCLKLDHYISRRTSNIYIYIYIYNQKQS